jgi:hypothetical protein
MKYLKTTDCDGDALFYIFPDEAYTEHKDVLTLLCTKARYGKYSLHDEMTTDVTYSWTEDWEEIIEYTLYDERIL